MQVWNLQPQQKYSAKIQKYKNTAVVNSELKYSRR